MTQQNTNMDLSQPIANADGTPTPYMEELWYSIVATTGGEDGDLINDLIDSQKLAAFGNAIDALSKEIDDIKATNPALTNLSSLITGLRKDIDDVLAQLQLRQDTTAIIKKLDQLESQIGSRVDLSDIIKRLDTIEAQL